jgi:hypothetical protein
VLCSVRCVLEIWCGWVWVVSVLQAEACNTDTTQTQPHHISNTQRTENKTTDVVIQQHSRKLLMMDILRPETCWVHKKWNKIKSDIKFWRFADRASEYLINLMHKICFTVSFISCLYMFRAHMLIIRRSKLHYTASGIITPIGGRLVLGLREDCLHQVD